MGMIIIVAALIIGYPTIVAPLWPARKKAQGASDPRRAFWTTYARLMVWRGPLFAILIWAICAFVSALWPFIVHAQYLNAEPVLGNLRTKIELYRVENDRLPGAATNLIGQIQSWSGSATGGWTITVGGSAYTKGDDFFSVMDVRATDLIGKFMAPCDIQYMPVESDAETYLYALGVFGSGTPPSKTGSRGLAKGCGYAFMDYSNTNIIPSERAVLKFELITLDRPNQFVLTMGSAGATNHTDQFLYVPEWSEVAGGLEAPNGPKAALNAEWWRW